MHKIKWICCLLNSTLFNFETLINSWKISVFYTCWFVIRLLDGLQFEKDRERSTKLEAVQVSPECQIFSQCERWFCLMMIKHSQPRFPSNLQFPGKISTKFSSLIRKHISLYAKSIRMTCNSDSKMRCVW